MVCIEECDHEDRSDVIDDGERQQEQAAAEWHPGSEQGHHPEGEGNVGGHRDAPAIHRSGAPGEGEVDEGRYHHSAQRGESGECGGAGVAQIAGHQFAFDLEADHEEEDRHQPIVDHQP